MSAAGAPEGRPQARARQAGAGWPLWLLLGWAGFVALPWYLPQDLTLWRALAGVWGGADTASGLLQVLRHGRPWLAVAAVGLGAGLVAWRLPTLRSPAGRAQGRWLAGGAALALAGLLASGFAIGAQGWAFESLGQAVGALPTGQPGIGLGGAVVLLALLMLLGTGIARLGGFKGDAFVASAVVLSTALLLLFVALPVAKALVGRCRTRRAGGLWPRWLNGWARSGCGAWVA